MSNIYLSHNNIVSAYGFDSASAVDSIKNEVSGLSLVDDSKILPNPFYSSLIAQDNLSKAFQKLNPQEDYTRLEQILLVSLANTLKESGLELTDRVGLIVSTTKGNIDVLDADNPFDQNRAYLSELGKKIETFFGFKNEAIVLSNACVSGVLALAVAKRFIHQKRYDHVFVVAGDLVSQFILTGFNSFQALSELPCRPFCKTRAGINIGEVGCSVLVTKDEDHLVNESVRIIGEASCNDANHISGPSRTGEGLYRSVVSAMNQANIEAEAIDYISAHGTATMFNDEMEAIAFNRAYLQDTPLNSLKGYFGHTLGASGLLETIIGMYSLHSNTLFASLGFQELGVSQPLNIITETTAKESSIFLKTASGFGGCNTAAIFQKVNS
ncbi:beta-ketoacyl synthase N-terminal-like domain-containing protein [Zobellia laminariae]|uniref:beta-ketoacyl synthase N-terminal-like domain-containing protein n=1 Tax=Zobellia laminariae TaxID=248906 RepID=UPI0026F46DB2|nr:beta-ketoacyl synthase N-terminal-like domain-containing protein [Zobellia laminariae]WKX78245.1 beta-ketoacyl synthase N-terminal-like domain-containing protein [Zobellia laminariae]